MFVSFEIAFIKVVAVGSRGALGRFWPANLVQLQKELYLRVFMLKRWFTTQIEAYKNTKNFLGWIFEFRPRIFVAWPRS